MATKHQLIPVPFMGDTLEVVEYQGEPHVAVKRIVQNLGLDWKNQHEKLTTNRKRWGVVQIRIPSAGGQQESVCMPLRKLPGFMQTIDASRVPAEKRPRVELYQEKSDKALWDFWTKGHAVHPQAVKSLPAPKAKTRTITEERYVELLECENKVLKGVELRNGIPYELKMEIVGYHLEGLKPAQIRDITGVKKATISTQIRNYKKGTLK